MTTPGPSPIEALTRILAAERIRQAERAEAAARQRRSA